ncbi:MAG TPA: serpin family protein [Clostridia bacterium]|nr:serpin family protein [Clostridia bacterium]
MKRWLGLMVCLVGAAGILLGCSDGFLPSSGSGDFDRNKISLEIIEGNSRFAWDIFKQLNEEDSDESIFISPLSISTALTMTYQGAGTTTKEAMAGTLGYTNINDDTLNESYKNLIRYLECLDPKVHLNISNSLWIREGEVIKEDFLSTNKDIFDAPATSLDFSQQNAADEINQWISKATNKKIEKMIDSPIAPDIVMYLINAIYFKGDWTSQFDQKNTFRTEFQAGDGSTREVMMMSRNGEVEYGQGDGFKAVRLPYGSGKMAMYCILPEEGEPINNFIMGLDVERWKIIRDSISERDQVLLRLPRFKLEYGIKQLNDSLIALGMEEAFSERADFSGIREGVYVSEVLHKAVIEVNEKGSEAAAATVVVVKECAAVEPLTFIADRPFIFVIADDETGTILFMGKVYDISQSQEG